MMIHTVMSQLTHMMVVLLMYMMEHLLEVVLEHWATCGKAHSQEDSTGQMVTQTAMASLPADKMAEVEVHIVMHSLEAVLEHQPACGMEHSQEDSTEQVAIHPLMVFQMSEMVQEQVIVMYSLDELVDVK